MSSTTSRRNAFIPNNKAADPCQGSAASSIAATGQPPASHERAIVIVGRRRSLGNCADRMARYKVDPTYRAARCLRGAACERDTRLDTLRTASVPLMLCLTGSLTTFPSSIATRQRRRRAVRGRVEPKPRVKTSQEGIAPPRDRRRLVHARERDPGRLAPRRTRLHGRRLSAPTLRDFGPTTRPREGLLRIAISHQCEATWRTRPSGLGAIPRARGDGRLALLS